MQVGKSGGDPMLRSGYEDGWSCSSPALITCRRCVGWRLCSTYSSNKPSGIGARRAIKDPFRQAQSEKFAILDQIKVHPKWRGWPGRPADHAVFFPICMTSACVPWERIARAHSAVAQRTVHEHYRWSCASNLQCNAGAVGRCHLGCCRGSSVLTSLMDAHDSPRIRDR